MGGAWLCTLKLEARSQECLGIEIMALFNLVVHLHLRWHLGGVSGFPPAKPSPPPTPLPPSLVQVRELLTTYLGWSWGGSWGQPAFSSGSGRAIAVKHVLLQCEACTRESTGSLPVGFTPSRCYSFHFAGSEYTCGAGVSGRWRGGGISHVGPWAPL